MWAHTGGEAAVDTVKVRRIAWVSVGRRPRKRVPGMVFFIECLMAAAKSHDPQPSPQYPPTPGGDPDAVHRLDVGGRFPLDPA